MFLVTSALLIYYYSDVKLSAVWIKDNDMGKFVESKIYTE